MSDKLYLTLAQEIIEYRKDNKIESGINNYQMIYYIRLVNNLYANNFIADYQQEFLKDCIHDELENLYTDSNYIIHI